VNASNDGLSVDVSVDLIIGLKVAVRVDVAIVKDSRPDGLPHSPLYTLSHRQDWDPDNGLRPPLET
jgi:hypothetical protein